jgi:SAM-dependent methyltransferase
MPGEPGGIKMTDRGYELSAQFYDLFDLKQNINFFYFYASQAGEILDIGAGTGRIAIPLAELGCRMVCVEPSEAMREQLEQKVAQQPVTVQERILIEPADAASFKLGRTYPLAILSGSFRHFLNDEERLLALKNIAAHLKPGGSLVFDISLGMMQDQPLSPAGVVNLPDGEIRRRVATKVLPEGTLQVTLVFETYRNDKMVERIVQGSIQGIVNREGIRNLLAQAGFEVIEEYADYDFRPYEEGEPLLMVEARKVNGGS